MLSITAFVMRFIIMIGGIIAVIWYVDRYDLTKGEVGLICLAVLGPILLIWFVVETAAWNRDLRQKGISTDHDTWTVNQFPQE